MQSFIILVHFFEKPCPEVFPLSYVIAWVSKAV